jgi:hypothetical protein
MYPEFFRTERSSRVKTEDIQHLNESRLVQLGLPPDFFYR